MSPVRPHKRHLSTLVLGLLASPAFAQVEYFGPWHSMPPQSSPITLNIWVSPPPPAGIGLPPGGQNGLGPAIPINSITNAINLANSTRLPNQRVVINLLNGTYSAALTNEQFPLTLPAFGYTLEAAEYDISNIPAAAPTIDAGSSQVAVYITNPGDQVLPASQIRNLAIGNCVNAVFIDPNVGASWTKPAAVELRDCAISGFTSFGVVAKVPVGHTALHVIEGNTFDALGFPAETIRVESSGKSSVLVRGNSIANGQIGVNVLNLNGVAADCIPRLLSNFVQGAAVNVSLLDCRSILNHNTIAFAGATLGAATGVGVSAVGGQLELRGNSLWNPDNGGTNHRDLVTSGTAVTSTLNGFNDPADAAGTNNVLFAPGYVGGDTFGGGFTVRDLHLTAASPLQDLGTPLVLSTIPLDATRSVRVDHGVDADRDSRGIAPDLGADERSGVRLSFVEVQGVVDRSGTVHQSATNTYDFSLALRGAPNGAFALYMGLGFQTQVPITPPAANGATYENVFTPWGNLQLDLISAGTGLFVVSGAFDATGNATVPVSLPAVAGSFESEVHFQFLGQEPSGNFKLSNRLFVELDS